MKLSISLTAACSQLTISLVTFLGSAYEGVDISDFTNVGMRNHYTFHNVNLQNGHTYFASVRGKLTICFKYSFILTIKRVCFIL